MSLTCYRNAKYLRWIRERVCVSCGLGPGDDTVAAHVRLGNGGGMGLKPSDYRTVPLCRPCHDMQHRVGERTFWGELGMDPDAVVGALLLRYVQRTKDAVSALESLIELERGGGEGKVL